MLGNWRKTEVMRVIGIDKHSLFVSQCGGSVCPTSLVNIWTVEYVSKEWDPWFWPRQIFELGSDLSGGRSKIGLLSGRGGDHVLQGTEAGAFRFSQELDFLINCIKNSAYSGWSQCQVNWSFKSVIDKSGWDWQLSLNHTAKIQYFLSTTSWNWRSGCQS